MSYWWIVLIAIIYLLMGWKTAGFYRQMSNKGVRQTIKADRWDKIKLICSFILWPLLIIIVGLMALATPTALLIENLVRRMKKIERIFISITKVGSR